VSTAAGPRDADAAATPRVESVQSHRRPSRRAIGSVLLAVLLIAGVALLVQQLSGAVRSTHALALPQKVDGLPLVGAAGSAAQQALTAEGWTDVAAGGYGSGAGQLLLLIGRPAASMSDGDGFLRGLQAPLVQQGFVFNASTSTTTPADGTKFVCGPVSAASGQLSLCTWTDGDAAGVVVDYSGATLTQVVSLAQAARAASEH